MKTRLSGLFAVIVTAAFAASIAGCGGGGGGGGTTPTPVTITCPNGTTATDASLCPAAKVVLVTDSVKGPVSPDSFTGVVVVTDSTLDPSSLTTANVTLKAGGVNAVAGTVSATDAKGFKFVPAAKLNYGQAYTFAATVKDTLGRTVSVTSSITTTNVTCAAPQVWTPGVNACVYPAGVVVTSPNKLAAGCTDTTQACFKDTVKWIATPAMAVGADPASNAGPIVGAYFTNALGHDQLTLFHADTGAVWGGGDINASGSSLKMTSVQGSKLGFIQAFEDGRRAELRWFPPTTQPGVSSNIWQNVQI